MISRFLKLIRRGFISCQRTQFFLVQFEAKRSNHGGPDEKLVWGTKELGEGEGEREGRKLTDKVLGHWKLIVKHEKHNHEFKKMMQKTIHSPTEVIRRCSQEKKRCD